MAEWQKVYDAIKTLSIGDTITYDDLGDLLGREFDADRSPFYKANDTLLQEHRRGLVCVRGVGYRVVTAEQHEQPARVKHKAARRQLRGARRWIEFADRAQLTPATAKRFDDIETSLRRQEDMTRRLDNRLSKVEQALQDSRKEQENKHSATDDKLAKLQAALERAGIKV